MADYWSTRFNSKSYNLRGAISIRSAVFSGEMGEPSGNHDMMVGRWESIKAALHNGNYLNNFTIDEENDIIFNENGAVADAYSLDEKYTDEELESIKNEILETAKADYPGYDFKLLEGHFPMTSFDDFYDYNVERYDSDYILYIANYDELLEKNKQKVLK